MIFLFPKKSIVLDCFTFDELILQTAPITSAIKHTPDWWRKLPSSVKHTDGFTFTSTMKNCVGMTDYYKDSVAIPLWSSLQLEVKGTQYRWQFSDGRTNANIHPKSQSAGLLPNHGNMKIISVWHLKTQEDVNWVWSQPLYSFEEPISDLKIMPGIFNFKFQKSTNINIMIPLNQEKIYTINQGQVLVHLTPMTDKKIKIKRHLISKQEFDSMSQQQITFVNSYRNIIKQKQKFADCPYYKKQNK
jgi:hypothetical protein